MSDWNRFRSDRISWPENSSQAARFINNAQMHLLNRGVKWHEDEHTILNSAHAAINIDPFSTFTSEYDDAVITVREV